MPGSTPATSQLDWLISTTAMIVLSWSNATRDLMKASPGAGGGRSAGASGHSVSYLPATMVPSPSPPAPYHLSAGAKRIRTAGARCRSHNEAQPCSSSGLPAEPAYECGGASLTKGSGCRMVSDLGGRCRIELAVSLLDPPRADVALHRDADMIWAIAGTCRIKFLSGFAGGQGKNTLAQA